VGINKYRNPALNLNYAVPDAKGIAGFFRQKGQLFKKVNIIEIYDAEATKERILAKLSELEKTNPQDAVLLQHGGGTEHQPGDGQADPVTALKRPLLPRHPPELAQGKGQDDEGAEQEAGAGEGDGAEIAGTDLLDDKGAAPDDRREGQEEIGLDSAHDGTTGREG